jgi:hypothetical protein
VAVGKYLENPLTWIVGGGLIGAWLFGVLHSFDSHRGIGTVVAVVFPPYGLYLSVERLSEHPGEKAMQGQAPDSRYLEQCLEEGVMTVQSELTDAQNQAFCTCTAQLLAEGLPEGEGEYIARHGRNSPEFETLRRTISESCLTSVQYVGA